MLDNIKPGKQRTVQLLYKFTEARDYDTGQELYQELRSLILDSSPSYRQELEETAQGNFIEYTTGIACLQMCKCLEEGQDIRFDPSCDLELIAFTVAFAINYAH